MKVRKELLADDAPAAVPIVVKGRVDAGELPPFENGQAAFALTDTTGHEGQTDHDPHECPFCSRHIEDYLAQVYFRDQDGNVIATDSRELFGIKEGAMVTVKGMATIGDDGMLHIDAEKIYIH